MTASAETDAATFWSERRSPEAYEAYWVAVAQPHRAALVRALHLLPSFKSLREVGCAVGTNLRLIREAFPWASLSGSDINAGAIAFAQPRLPDVAFTAADAMADSASWQPRSFDVLISCYSLAYVAPTDLGVFMERACTAARKGLVFVEPFGSGDLVAGLSFLEWRHAYLHVLTEALTRSGRTARMRPADLTPPVDRCNGMVSVTFQGEQ